MSFNWNNYVAFAQFNQQLVDDFCELLATADNPNDYFVQHEAARCVGLCLSDLTEADKEYISDKVAELKNM